MNEQTENQEAEIDAQTPIIKTTSNPISSNWSLGKISFVLSIVSFVMVIIYWLWIYDFHNNYPSGGFGSLGLFLFVTFAIPIVTIIIILATVSTISLGKFKKLRDQWCVLTGFIVSIIVLICYSLYFFL